MTFLRSHAGAIEADFSRYHHVDVWDELASGRMSLRRLRVLIEHLPSDAATWVSVEGPLATWTRGDQLMARAVHALEGANWQRSGGKQRKPRPVDLPPSKAVAVRKAAQVEDLRRRQAERRARREQRQRHRGR